jgi:DNA-binding beta-propeller fold protein YncE
VVTLAGDPKQPGGFANGASSSARFNEPHGVALDGSGRVYVADTVNNRIRVIEHGLVITLAGDGIPGLLNGPAAKARFNQPKGIAVLGAKIYVADTENHCVRVIENGSVSTLAGDGTPGMVDGLAEKARFHEPRGVAVDSSGKLAVADSYNHRVRLIGSGQVNTLAGSSAGFAEGSALAAKLYNPRGLAIGAASTIDIADANNHRIRRFSGGNVNTLAGTGLAGFLDGPLGSARFNTPSALVLASGTLHVADSSNHRIRSIAGGMVATLAGDGTSGHQDGPLPGRFGYPRGIAVDAAGRIYVADLENHCIRVILP